MNQKFFPVSIANWLKFSIIENLSVYWKRYKFDMTTSPSALRNRIYIFMIFKKIYDCLIKSYE